MQTTGLEIVFLPYEYSQGREPQSLRPCMIGIELLKHKAGLGRETWAACLSQGEVAAIFEDKVGSKSPCIILGYSCLKYSMQGSVSIRCSLKVGRKEASHDSDATDSCSHQV